MERNQGVATETQSNDLLNTTKIIYYRKGDESFPKTEDLSKENWSEYFFSDIYEKAVGIISDIVRVNVIESDNSFNDIKNVEFDKSNNNSKEVSNRFFNKTRNNIVAFIGERGAGKTSCLQTIYNGLCNVDSLNKLNCIFDRNLPIIDPSYFNEHSNILEILIAQMFQTFKDALQSSGNYLSSGDNNLEKKRKLVKCFQDVKETLDCINTPIKSSDTNDSVEALAKMSSSNNLKLKMEVLIETYLSYFYNDRKSVLVIAIDDLDVQTKHTYKMLEQISKYLIINRVVILIGVKLKQLSDLVKQNYYNDFRELLSKNGVTINQIDDMASRYLLKLIPFSHRLMLPSLNDISNVLINIENDETPIDLSKYLLNLIYKKTRIMFYNSLEQESLIIPHNFREMLNLLSFVLKLHDVENRSNRREIIARNRNAFKYYFVNSWCLDKLSSEQYLFIKELIDRDIIQINKFIVDTLYKWYEQYFSNSNIIDLKIFSAHNRSYNVSIADVQSVLDVLSTNNNTKIKCFIFAIKTVYSILLGDLCNEIKCSNVIDDKCNELIERFNHTIMSNWQSNNKLNYLSDYEKLIGGNILNIHRKKDNNNNYINEELYIGNINGEELINIYEKICIIYRNNNNSLNIDSFNDKNIINKFNVFEFFLLCGLIENNEQDYRTFKHCYYDSFPINDLSNQQITYSFTAILSNIIRFYRLYQLYFKIFKTNCYNVSFDNKSKELYRFKEFFSIIDSLREESIIYKILHKNAKMNIVNTRGIFKNEFLEQSFLINIEEIDIIENYMGHITKQRSSTIEIMSLLSEVENLETKQKEIESSLKYLNESLRGIRFNKYDLISVLSKYKDKSSKEFQKLQEEYNGLINEEEDILRDIQGYIKMKNECINMIDVSKDKIRNIKYLNIKNNIDYIESFFDKMSRFRYYANNDIYSNQNNIDKIRTFEFLEIIIEKFKKEKFIDCLYSIYDN